MKKIFIFIFLMITTLLTFSEIIDIETSKGLQKLIIPETQEELKDAYIDMAKMYLEERFDHEDSLDQIEDLFLQIDELINLNREATSISDNLITSLKKKLEPDIFRLYLLGTFGKDLYNLKFLNGYFIGIEIEGIFFERLNISVGYNIPARFQLSVGWRIGE